MNTKALVRHFYQFKQAIQPLEISFGGDIAEKIHLRIAEFAFRAYTSHFNDKIFNPKCDTSNDFGGLSWRTQVMTKCIASNGNTQKSVNTFTAQTEIERLESLFCVDRGTTHEISRCSSI